MPDGASKTSERECAHARRELGLNRRPRADVKLATQRIHLSTQREEIAHARRELGLDLTVTLFTGDQEKGACHARRELGLTLSADGAAR